MIELIENKINKALSIRKMNVYILIATISLLVISLLFLFSDNLYFRLLFIFPILGSIYYFYRINTYKKELDYLPKFLQAYSNLKEKESLKDNYKEPVEKKVKVKIVYKDKIIEKIIEVPVEKIVYKNKIIKKTIEVPVEKIIEKIVYKDKIVKVPVDKIIEKIVYKDKIIIKKGYVKKTNIYENNDILREIEEMLASRFYNIPLSDRARNIYSLINQMNVDKKIQHEYEKEKKTK